MTIERTYDLENFGRNNKRFFDNMLRKFPEYSYEMAEILAEEIKERAKDNILTGRDMEPVYFESEEVGKNTPQFTSEGSNRPRRESNRDGWEPLQDTGALYDSIEVQDISRSGMDTYFTIGSEHPGAGKMEVGGDNPWGLNDIPARPYLYPAFDWAETDIGFKRYFNRKIELMISTLIYESMGF